LNSNLKDKIPPEKKNQAFIRSVARIVSKYIKERQKDIWKLGLKNNLEILGLGK
jgi:hypothetical protein